MTTSAQNLINEQYTNPKTWGPHFWFMFRCISNNYPELPTPDDTKYTKSFFYSFQFILPCIICRESYVEHYNKHPIDEYLLNREKLLQWTEIIYKETNDNIIKQINETEKQKQINETEKQIQINIPENKIPPNPRICNTCGKRNVPNESAFPQANDINSGPNKGVVGALRKLLAKCDTQTKYTLIALYNWIKYPYRLPDINEASNILKGYIILKNSNLDGYYPNYFIINNQKTFMIEENAGILTNPVISNLIHDKFKALSI